MKTMWWLCIPIAGMCLSFLGTAFKRWQALKNNHLEIPNFRSSHEKPTPTGGGFGFTSTFLIVFLGLYMSNHLSLVDFMVFFLGGAFIAFIGGLDDKFHIRAIWRLFIHFLVIGVAFYLLGGLPDIWFEKSVFQYKCLWNIVAIIFLVWCINLFNFMDGIDGIAGSQAIFVFGASAIICLFINRDGVEAFLLLVLASGCCGFLFLNWPPAKIFMGDIGSGFLGYIIGVLMLRSVATGKVPIWVWLILLGVFFVDSTITLLRRLVHLEKIYEAHCSHAYQNASRRYHSHKKVTVAVLIINVIWLFPLAILAAICPDWGLIVTIIAFVPLVILAFNFGAGNREF